MKPIGEPASPPLIKSDTPTPRPAPRVTPATAMPSGLTVEHIERLWERMTMIYGHKWTSAFAQHDDGTWLTGLHDVAPEQIAVGLEACRTSDDPWPPTLPAFRAKCLRRKRIAAHRIALPVPPASRAERIAMLERVMPRIRELLK